MAEQPTLEPVGRPLNLIPVGLKEAALDSPTFRATALHFADQIESVERWLEGYLKAGTKLAHEISSLENAVNAFLQNSTPPAQVSEAVLDHDYTLLATKRYGEAAREFWQATFKGVKKSEVTVLEPVRAFISNELRWFKDARKTLDQAQRTFDSVIARYSGQAKTKEPSSLREDAFQLHEARKAYLKASMDFCVQAPQVRAALDKLLVKVFSDQWREMKVAREANVTFGRYGSEMDRIRGWAREMENSERAFKRELHIARRQLEDSAEQVWKPSRELEDYSVSTVPFLGSGAANAKPVSVQSDKQGWLFMKSVSGKPARTVWNRRWFFVKNGIFGWLIQSTRSGGVEESEKIGVLLCSVRPAVQEERRFCFEVKTKDTSIILQAETQNELTQWIGAFDVAKRKALEDPASTEAIPAATLGVDPAFAISPPIAPEFAAKVDGHMSQGSEDQGSGLIVPESAGPTRSSFDVTSSRRSTMVDRDRDAEGGRDHAARIIQKLDLHRKSTANPQVSSPTPSGGIASLISSSHSILPVGPSSPTPGFPDGRSFTMPASSLAPSTLANPPAPTNLSKTAVVVSGERGVGLGGSENGTPGGLMANLWGSANWGYINRLERQEVKPSATSPSGSPVVQPVLHSMDDVGVMDGMSEANKNFEHTTGNNTLSPGVRHRKTFSLNMEGSATPRASTFPIPLGGDEFPNYYPLPLKAQDAQFRILFPEVPRSEKVVLVFRATWNPNDAQEFPGRVYVTAREVYFYSNHLGLVLISGVSLSSIEEVTAAPGRDCDFLFLHLKETTKQNGFSRITVKTFLEPLKLLQRRLNYLVQNASSEPPASLEEVIKTLIRLEADVSEPSPDLESWEELDYEGPNDGDALKVARRRERDVKASLRIDGTLYGEKAGQTGREVTKFKLPAQAVVYTPQGFTSATVTREFSVSAKALFHVMFGDRSVVFQMVYRNRGMQNIIQSPWRQPEGSTHLTRAFACTANSTSITDRQTIDVSNDHLCYVVTEILTPWHLPHSASFLLTTKYVITHVAKSKSRLAIFHKILWKERAGLAWSRRLIEKAAFHDLAQDVLDLLTVATDQVAKLGAKSASKTNKAVSIFGQVGQATDAATVDVKDLPPLPAPASPTEQPTNSPRLRKRGLLGLYRNAALDVLLSFMSLLLDLVVAVARKTGSIASAHVFLISLLAVSAAYNTWHGYRDGLGWYHERAAGKFMARLGVKSDPGIARSVWLRDVEQLITPTLDTADALHVVNATSIERPVPNTCASTFREVVLASEDWGSEFDKKMSERRLWRTRHSLARYRHDLLVALRVVNRVEEEVVRSEWEEWVKEESRKCARVQGMLKEREERDGGKEERSGLGSEFEGYCDSCREELKGMVGK